MQANRLFYGKIFFLLKEEFDKIGSFVQSVLSEDYSRHVSFAKYFDDRDNSCKIYF